MFDKHVHEHVHPIATAPEPAEPADPKPASDVACVARELRLAIAAVVSEGESGITAQLSGALARLADAVGNSPCGEEGE